jgi:hypothetical protein
MLWLFNGGAEAWGTQLSKETSTMVEEQLGKDNFPFVSTTKLDYTPELVCCLSNLAAFNVHQIKDQFATLVPAADERAAPGASGTTSAQAAQRVDPGWEKGKEVIYTAADGTSEQVAIVRVHREDVELYYSIMVPSTGRERQTTLAKLSEVGDDAGAPPLAPPSSGKRCLVDFSVSSTDERHTHGLGMKLAPDLTVTLVAEGGQAIAQGVVVGDVVTAVGGRQLSSVVGNTDKDVKSALVAAKEAGTDLEIIFNGTISAVKLADLETNPEGQSSALA